MSTTNKNTIEFLIEKKKSFSSDNILVRVPVHNPAVCIDFEYINIDELIKLLQNNQIFLKPEQMETFIEE